MPEEPSISKTLTQDQIEEMRKEASSALHGDTMAYETKASRSGSSDHQWARTLLNKGAIGDRVAAATILIQDNPIYNLTALRNMINNVKPAKKKDGIIIIDALSELLISELLIPDIKLRTFEQHPLGHVDEMTSGNKQARRNILKLWYFEDQLKELYGGVKRAYPFANKERMAESASHVDHIHRLVHLAGINVAIHALALLFHISDASQTTADRYYTALYRKLTNAEIFNTTHSALLFSLIYKSLKQDKNIPRVTSFIKRLLQLCCYMTPAQSCGMLFLISQVLKDGEKKQAVKLEIKEEVPEIEDSQDESAEDTVTEVNTTLNDTADDEYSGDPLKDFAGIRFLDRFVFKNPKKRADTQQDDGIKKVKGSHPKFAIRKNYTAKAESDDELDYLADMAATKQKRGNKKLDDDDDNQLGSDDDDDDDDDDEGDEAPAGGDDGDEEDGELLLEDSDDDDDKIDVPGTRSKKGKGKLKLKGGDDLGSLFASAEEFSTLLEETATNKKQGSSQAVANTDNASSKQLAWEDNRDRWIKGYNRKILGNKSNSKKFKNKKGNFNKSDNKSKPNKKGFNKMADKGGKRKGAKVNGPGGKKKKMK
ncbi:hypothetical protein HF086_014305 [Spodoptera exigua]|uniref:CCAAT-binding factor domain-containing protein n=1 Tax=Spodoptera exigua TaxID=7107 RepID=A0A922MJM3_SPOEX|nr:hypothetical protein HF086_014305 [Spodoptera exigua]